MPELASTPAGSASLSRLDALFGPGGGRDFLHEHWPARPAYVKGTLDRLPAWCRADVLHDLDLLDRHYNDRVDVTRGGIGQYEVWGAAPSRWATDLRLATRLRNLTGLLGGAAEWIEGLERELGVPPGSTELGAFLNPPGVGLHGHCDRTEHIVIHVQGSKRFRIRPNPGGAFVSASHALRFAAPREAVVQYPQGFPDWDTLPDDGETRSFVLEPGDVLFVPRGWYHDTKGEGDTLSLSLVAQVKCPSYLDVLLSHLRSLLAQDPRWRAPLVGDLESTADRLSELWATTASRATRVDAGLAVCGAGTRPVSRLLRAGALVVRCPSVRLATQRSSDGRVEVTTTPHQGLGRPRTVVVEEDAAELIEALASDPRPRRFAELCQRHDDWDEDSLLAIVEFLTARGALLLVPVELWDSSSRE